MKKRNENLFYDLCLILPCIILGLWMMISPDNNKEHLEIEKATVHFIKEIWGLPAGLTILVFGLFWLIPTIIKYKKIEKPKPNNMSYMFYSICFFILTVVGSLYVVVLLQNFLGTRGIIPVKYVHEKMYVIHMVFIMFIFVFSIIALIAKWRSRIAK